MKILHLIIITILITGVSFMIPSHVFANNIPGPYFPPTLNLNETQKQWLVKQAMTVSGIKTWSESWQFGFVDYAGTQIPTPHWQTMMLHLFLPPQFHAPKYCSSGWQAIVVFDYNTGMILDSVYP